MSAFDLTLLSLYRIGGQEWPQLPGLLAQNPPRRPARGREQDRLLVYLTLAGNISYSTSEYAQIANQVSETFYATAGSLTYALKTATEGLNAFLVERNMKTTGKGLYSIGALVLAALRGNQLYLVQCGPTHVYRLGAELTHFNDAQLAGKGLGLSQTARMYFSQVTLNAGDRVLFCAALPPNWDKALGEDRGRSSLESTRRRLMAVTDSNISAVLIQVAEGTGVMNLQRSSKDLPAESAPAAAPAPAPRPALQPASLPPAAVLPDNQPEAAPTAVPAPGVPHPVIEAASRPVTEPPVQPTPQPVSRSAARRAAAAEYSPEPKVLLTPERKEQFQKSLRGIARFLAQAIQSARENGGKLAAALEKFLPRLLPGDEQELAPSLRSLPLFIAILVPVLVATIGVVLYSNWGVPEQYRTYYSQALATREQALVETNPVRQRELWKTVIDGLDSADSYTSEKPTEESGNLRREAQNALDSLNRTVRLEFKPAFNGSLSPGLVVTRMAASDTDLYLLDATRGTVMRGVYNNRNYDMDGSFECGPGSYDGIQVGNLIDIVALPRSNPSAATLLGIDASGNLLYCIPDEKPHATFLKMPDTGWNKITAFAYDANNLYVLDAPARAVWVYFGAADLTFPDNPYYFFESQVPLEMEKTTGMAVNGDDLYLLHADGHLTTCTLSRISVSPTRCNDPAVFIDTRPGFQGGIRLADGNFSQVAFTTPPDPSVALLQPYTQSVFRFSARALELQSQIQGLAKGSLIPEGAEITAMTFSPNKFMFLFAGNQVYFAINIP